MMSDEDFFDKFRDSVIGPEPPAENEDQDDDDVDVPSPPSHAVKFLMHQFNMIPKQCQPLF